MRTISGACTVAAGARAQLVAEQIATSSGGIIEEDCHGFRVIWHLSFAQLWDAIQALACIVQVPRRN